MPQHTRQQAFDADIALELEDDFAPGFDSIGENNVQLSLPEADLRFVRDFILGSATYVEELENAVCDRSDEYWEARETPTTSSPVCRSMFIGMRWSSASTMPTRDGLPRG